MHLIVDMHEPCGQDDALALPEEVPAAATAAKDGVLHDPPLGEDGGGEPECLLESGGEEREVGGCEPFVRRCRVRDQVDIGVRVGSEPLPARGVDLGLEPGEPAVLEGEGEEPVDGPGRVRLGSPDVDGKDKGDFFGGLRMWMC
jgi:hypothetical protein